MDFLKKKMKELMDDDKPAAGSAPQPGMGERSQSDSYYNQGGAPDGPPGYPPQGGGYPPQGPPGASPGGPPGGPPGYAPQGHGYPPQGQGYPPQGYGQQPYGQQAPPVGPPAPYGAPPPMPPGWTQQWDQGSQRWYYIEQATGRTQWDPPSNLPPGPYAPPAVGAPYMPPAGHDERGLFGNTHGHQGHDYTASGQATNQKEEKKGHSTAMLAGGAVAGLAAGGLIGHMMSGDSDDEDKAQPPPQQYQQPPPGGGGYGADPGYQADPYGDQAFQEPPPVPTHDADGDSISSSERSSLESKREELIEAQEEYQEEVEEAYDD